MCTFFVKKPSQKVNKEHFVTIIENNPQGFGFMYTTGEKIVIVKSASPNAESMWKKFQMAEQKFPKSHFIGHGRIATGSNINSDNTHPFMVNKSLAMVHNGIIRQFPSTVKKSDTVQYIEQVLRCLPKDFYKNKAMMDLLGRDIVGSKFAFLTVDNKVYYVNRYACVVDKDTQVVYSNRNYEKSDWLDYGGTKISKSDLYGTSDKKYVSSWKSEDTKYFEQPKLDFHIDSKSHTIKESSDWEFCTDCEDWVRKTQYDTKLECCIDCKQDIESYNESFGLDYKGRDKSLNYCEECDVNVASHTWEDFHLCDECVKMYKPVTNDRGITWSDSNVLF